MRRFIAWLFTKPSAPTSSVAAIRWWERRRLAYNLIVLGFGAVCLVIFVVSIVGSGRLAPGEDAIEPLALIALPLVVNVA